MIPMSQLIDGVANFATNDVIPAMPNGLDKFLAYAAVGAMRGRYEEFAQRYIPALSSVGIVTGDGNVDEVALKNSLKEAFQNVPTVQFLGFTFDRTDADKLFRRIGI